MTLHVQRLAAAVILSVGLSWILPLQYFRATSSDRFTLTGSYSALLDEFVIWEQGPDFRIPYRENGEKLSTRKSRMLLPFIYYHDVQKWNGFPVKVQDRIITYEQASRAMRGMSLSPRMWNRDNVALYMLLESSPEEADFQLPPDVLRVLPDRLEFLNCDDGALNGGKSEEFTLAVREAGVQFPIARAGSNSNPLKPFDMGLLLADARGRLFQLKMVGGRPECRNLDLRVPGEIRSILVQEDQAHDFWGIVIAEDGVCLVTHGDRLIRLPLPAFSADNGSLSLFADVLNMTLRYRTLPAAGNTPFTLVATDRAGRALRQKILHLPETFQQKRQLVEDIGAALFPVALSQFEPVRGGAGLSLRPWADAGRHLAFAAGGGLLWCLLVFALRGRKHRAHVLEYVLVFVLGVPGLVSILAFGPLKNLRVAEMDNV